MAKGIIYGLVLATISVGFLTPYVYYPHLGPGVFSTGLGWKLIFAIYLWHVAFGTNLGLLYNPIGRREVARGRWVPAAGGDVRESRNPATGETLGSVAEAGQADVDAAVQAAAPGAGGDRRYVTACPPACSSVQTSEAQTG